MPKRNESDCEDNIQKEMIIDSKKNGELWCNDKMSWTPSSLFTGGKPCKSTDETDMT